MDDDSARMREENKALIRRVEEAWSAGYFDLLGELFDPSMVSHAAVPYLPPGLQGWIKAHRQMTHAVPDRRVSIEDIIAEGDRVAVRCRMTGTNLGGLPWAGVEPNGNPIDMEWISIYRVAGGKVVEHWAINDMATLVRQIGAPADLIGSRILRGGWPVLA